MIGLVIDNPPPIGQSYKVDNLALAFEIRLNENVLLKKNIDKPLYPFWGINRRSGVALFQYEVPEDLPKDEMLICRLTIIGDNDQFAKKYQNPHILITKDSDK